MSSDGRAKVIVVYGRCRDCGIEWAERAPELIVVCPECGSVEVEELDEDEVDPDRQRWAWDLLK